MGQNAVAVVEELGKQLALRADSGLEEVDTSKAIFFDVLGLFMVSLPCNNCTCTVSHAFSLSIIAC